MDTVVDPLKSCGLGSLYQMGAEPHLADNVGSVMSWQNERPPGAIAQCEPSGGGVLTEEVPGCSGKQGFRLRQEPSLWAT